MIKLSNGEIPEYKGYQAVGGKYAERLHQQKVWDLNAAIRSGTEKSAKALQKRLDKDYRDNNAAIVIPKDTWSPDVD
jgi:hypothetical protein